MIGQAPMSFFQHSSVCTKCGTIYSVQCSREHFLFSAVKHHKLQGALGWMARKVVLVCNINYTGRPLHPIKNSPARNFTREELKWYYQEQYHSKAF